MKKSSLQLLAQEYDISIKKAELIQAKIWDLPFFYGEVNAINPSPNRYFDAGRTGQKSAQIQQLFYLGGKKRNEINFAKSNVELAELQYESVVRNLKYQLRLSFYKIYFESTKFNTLNLQVTNLDSLVYRYSVQAKKGNVPYKNLVRLQALSILMQSALAEFQKNIADEQENIKILLNINQSIIPIFEESKSLDVISKEKVLDKQNLEEKVLAGNVEYLYSLKVQNSAALYAKWQKSLAVPDVTLGGSYDQRGGAFNNQLNITIGIPLPLWNRNKGNIIASQAEVSRTKLFSEQKALELKSQLGNRYDMFLFQRNKYNTTIKNMPEMISINSGVLQNFKKGNISIFDFTDFMESYYETIISITDIKKQLLLYSEELNYITNTELF